MVCIENLCPSRFRRRSAQRVRTCYTSLVRMMSKDNRFYLTAVSASHLSPDSRVVDLPESDEDTEITEMIGLIFSPQVICCALDKV